MANYEVKVKRTPGRPRKEDGTPEQMAKRAKWRKAKLIELEETAKYEKLALRNAKIRDEVLGTVCAATGSTERLEVHHIKPSTATDASRRALNVKSTCAPETIRAALKDCVRLCKEVHQEIHRKVDAEMAEIDGMTNWSSESARKVVKDWVCEKTTRAIIIKYNIISKMESI